MRTRVKICGLTRHEDARAAVDFGADAVGLVFYKPSPRCVSPGLAREIVRGIPPLVTAVGVFVNPDRREVEEAIDTCGVSLLQFHGDEPPEFCSSFSTPYVKAVRIRPGLDLLKYLLPYTTAGAWMLDAYHDDLYGGTGAAFDWGIVPKNLPKPTILSGGLNAGNVETAVRRVRPYAVDVSTGVEVSKGIKEAARIAAFIEAVKNADG